jgi:TrmH family RNA methyltransferase
MITSTKNPKIHFTRSLNAQSRARREAQAFVVEGVRLAEEALQAGWTAQLVLYTGDLSERGRAVVDGFAARGAPVEAVTPRVLESASDTQTPQGLLVVLITRALPLPPNPDFILVADGLRDPGNLGTVLRTAHAAGVQAVLLPPGAVDPFAPKVVRAAMGAHFRLAVHHLSWPDVRDYLTAREPRPRAYLADAQGGIPYTQVDFRHPTVLIFGGEAEGAGAEAGSLAEARLHIPMPGEAESLNAAVAAAILMFEVVRQRA